MSREETVKRIEESGIVAVLRLDDTQNICHIFEALMNAGVIALEITMTTPGAIDIIKEYAQKLDGDFILGAGTVLTPEDARQAIEYGAKFIVSPVFNEDILKVSQEMGAAVFPGAFSPNEILNAWQKGADVIKVFPATTLGPGYFKDIHGPLPEIKLTPTGGVNLENTAAFLNAGARFVGVGTSLLDKTLIATENWKGLTERAALFIAEVEKTRHLV
ncbi:MAG: bifunctional 4-hydroxy-2-oxoglutarate aldolase/2-dehydro-3-deoxy-phosphogluconate aldolase [Calditrichaeota bacterium]|nr:MAG: bifunctional 4-hydroxy-2-oxoglutarate aldolase/2-dehydro-3-deoxy-phosphogluconate aldolase [Calditrichota bacterium]MBL1208110.1 bifunctional 4-hydroxy-2-oxoglutarate aldolase/2-dehydro-3-deoxy-phosphogluconate aldolase [Calditrichota bacterium]NOG47948.1 bifunctional 4-hydroxy-2-oxoglutarate aldolase/2-dehydro-3-deoxy-phosphogluconate aldolase [Calditrichota bacterium]